MSVLHFCNFGDLRWLLIDLGVSLGPWFVRSGSSDHSWHFGFLDFLTWRDFFASAAKKRSEVLPAQKDDGAVCIFGYGCRSPKFFVIPPAAGHRAGPSLISAHVAPHSEAIDVASETCGIRPLPGIFFFDAWRMLPEMGAKFDFAIDVAPARAYAERNKAAANTGTKRGRNLAERALLPSLLNQLNLLLLLRLSKSLVPPIGTRTEVRRKPKHPLREVPGRLATSSLLQDLEELMVSRAFDNIQLAPDAPG